ncbi:MAG: adenosylcobinamide-GDP ribazoletransferase [Hyphomicrobiaceae bacterium]|nr:adenosylcobinamide-GDP ribazoletransferase [Hyphomicrobiaceae bacterium]
MRTLEAITVRDGGRLARRLSEEMVLAAALLTRLPLPRIEIVTGAHLASAFWAYPVVGAIVGAFGAGAYAVCEALDLGMFISTFVALAAMVGVTGAFHEDGLADFCDGIGGGQSREDKLEIMRDSRIGTYGAMALMFLVILLGAVLVELSISPLQPLIGGFSSVFIVVGALQRAAIGVPLALLQPARAEGYTVAAGRPPIRALAAGVGLATLLAVTLLGPAAALAGLAGAAAAAGLVTLIAWRYLGGFTGDALGATAATSGFAALLGLLMYAKSIPV